MGVKDLWVLLSPIGRRVSLETLERKALAIDVSIWITQFIKAMRDDEGKMVKNAHLLGTLRRILKLLYHKINPVFVFDGATPKLKEKTVQQRRKRRKTTEEGQQKNLQKLYLSMLKKEALEAELARKEGRVKPSGASAAGALQSPVGGSFADNFAPWNPSMSSSAPVSAPPAAAAAAAAAGRAGTSASDYKAAKSATSDGGDIDWLDLSDDDDAPHKRLEGSDEDEDEDDDGPLSDGFSSHHGRHNGGRGRQRGRYQVPSDGNFDIDTMAALDVHVRKELAEELRRNLRTRSRREFAVVKDNPELYSQTQIANFGRTSELNKRLVSVQQKVDGASEGSRIDGEVGTKFVLYDKSERQKLEQQQ